MICPHITIIRQNNNDTHIVNIEQAYYILLYNLHQLFNTYIFIYLLLIYYKSLIIMIFIQTMEKKLMSQPNSSVFSILLALGANFIITISKGVGAFYTGSGSLFAEAIHSAADCGNQLLLLFGLKAAKKAPTEEHPLGSGKEIYFWSFIVALMLFSIGGLVSIYEGVHKLQSNEPLSMPHVAIIILVISVIVEGGALFGCIKQINKIKGDQSLWQWFRESRQSELMVILGEDSAALVGLSLALIAVTASAITGNPMYDAMGSIAIGVLLIIVAFLLGKEVKDLLVGQGVEKSVKAEMIEFINSQPEVNKVFNFVSLQMGDNAMVSVKMKMEEEVDAKKLINDVNAVETRFKEKYPNVSWLFVEPDHTD